AFERIVSTPVVHNGNSQSAIDGNRQRLDNLRHHMFRRNKIDVVATLRLKLQHHAGYCLRRTTRNGWSGRYSLTDVVVLAKDTSQIAVRKEHRSSHEGSTPRQNARNNNR